MSLRRAILAAIAGATTPACAYSLGPWTECQVDPQSCATSATEWPTFADCAAKAPLQFEIGTGEKSYVGLAPGQAPTVHSATGGGQGLFVRHINLGVRIINPDLLRRRFRIEARTFFKSGDFFAGYPSDACIPGAAGDAAAQTASTPEAEPGQPVQWSCGYGGNHFIVDTSLKLAADGSLSRGGLRVFVHDLPHVLEVSVSDQCGRTTHAARTFRTD